MCAHVEVGTSKYLRGDLLQLRDVVKEGELCHPIMLDANGEDCTIAIKNDIATGITIRSGSAYLRQLLDIHRDCYLPVQPQGRLFLCSLGLRIHRF